MNKPKETNAQKASVKQGFERTKQASNKPKDYVDITTQKDGQLSVKTRLVLLA
jgi:hypothetical protein